MVFSCVIVDDEPMARGLLTQYVQKVPSLRLVQACASPMEALALLQAEPVDILFLDIQMPEITGLSLLKILRRKPLVILTTAYSAYALEGYEHDVVDYLLKPITLERFLKAVEKAVQRLQGVSQPPASQDAPAPAALSPEGQPEPRPGFIFVKDGTRLVKVRLHEITYIEGLKDYVIIHTPRQKVVTLQRLKSLETQLPEDAFIRIHNSYIVALDWIDAIHKDKVQIGTVFIPVSDTYRKAFRDFIGQHHTGWEKGSL
ncbi:MAG: LytTR family DNA-binding domain-containing protein [Bacteroidia bacterium]|nr:LytTR family DNA-binding domain-containing protein [Bacteroidia bacterium]